MSFGLHLIDKVVYQMSSEKSQVSKFGVAMPTPASNVPPSVPRISYLQALREGPWRLWKALGRSRECPYSHEDTSTCQPVHGIPEALHGPPRPSISPPWAFQGPPCDYCYVFLYDMLCGIAAMRPLVSLGRAAMWPLFL